MTQAAPIRRNDIAIELAGVTKNFRTKTSVVTALDNIDLVVKRGEFLAIVGPSGCGKSTILNLVCGLMTPSAGTLIYEGKPVPRPNTEVGYITQRDNLLPWKTARQNIELALKIRGDSAQSRRQKTDDFIDLVGLEGFSDAYPKELSGGMRKRVSLARTLVYEPEALLLDEPFGALDAQLKLVLAGELLRIWDATRSTVIFITHDIDEAITLADRVIVMSRRPGRVRAELSVDLPRPRNVFDIKGHPGFAPLYTRIWNEIVDDVRASEAPDD